MSHDFVSIQSAPSHSVRITLLECPPCDGNAYIRYPSQNETTTYHRISPPSNAVENQAVHCFVLYAKAQKNAPHEHMIIFLEFHHIDSLILDERPFFVKQMDAI